MNEEQKRALIAGHCIDLRRFFAYPNEKKRHPDGRLADVLYHITRIESLKEYDNPAYEFFLAGTRVILDECVAAWEKETGKSKQQILEAMVQAQYVSVEDKAHPVETLLKNPQAVYQMNGCDDKTPQNIEMIWEYGLAKGVTFSPSWIQKQLGDFKTAPVECDAYLPIIEQTLTDKYIGLVGISRAIEKGITPEIIARGKHRDALVEKMATQPDCFIR